MGIVFIPKEVWDLKEMDEDILISASLDTTARSWSIASGKSLKVSKE